MMPSSLQSIGQQTNKTTKMHKERIILGIDPGTNVMGYGILRVLDTKASMVAMGVIDLRPLHDPYLKLGRIFERVTGIIDEFLPDEMAIEAPFFGKNVQSMLARARARRSHRGRHPPRHPHPRVCATENQNGHHRTRPSL